MNRLLTNLERIVKVNIQMGYTMKEISKDLNKTKNQIINIINRVNKKRKINLFKVEEDNRRLKKWILKN